MITEIMSAALNAVDPYEAVSCHLHRQGNNLLIGDRLYSLNNFKRIFLIGAGKASVPMAEAAIKTIGELITSGVIITKRGHLQHGVSFPSNIEIVQAGHPLPDEDGIEASWRIIQLLRKTSSTDLVICLISGGGSALMTYPKPGISPQEIQELTSNLLACGATIEEINTLRKHIDQVKGGGLVAQAPSAQWVSLILSDVIGDPLDRIASGPTAPDPSTYQDAFEVLEKYHLREKTPGTIINHLWQGIRGQIPETLKPESPVFEHVNNLIVGNNFLAAEAALHQAKKFSLNTLLLTTSAQGEASQIGIFLASIVQQIERSNQPLPRPACVVVGGETTVKLHGTGLGGRNQELALGAVSQMAGLKDTFLISLATDGGDGPTDAAGAVVTGETLSRSLILGMNSAVYLKNNDSYHFFSALDDLLKPGPTLTNVGDLIFLFAL